MTISLRSIKLIMHKTVPGRISDDAVLMLKMHLETKAMQLAEEALRVYESENLMRKRLGERPKKLLAPRHMIAAIEGRFSDEEGPKGEH